MLQRVLGRSHFKRSPVCLSNVCGYSQISVKKFCTCSVASVCKFSNQRIMKLACETPSVGEMHFVLSPDISGLSIASEFKHCCSVSMSCNLIDYLGHSFVRVMKRQTAICISHRTSSTSSGNAPI